MRYSPEESSITIYLMVFRIVKLDGVVKTLHLLRCCEFFIITTYLSTPK